ncbi:unnamed protein product [Schistosoma mattheei]|uniref:Ig-like domain-containing protein n=1 Tax=Schistosoma mattheei TaxID=31246 RepID=A0AA85BTU9_9TREM|nr:unnamed protein product [Schistosoma mattheei]
MFSIHRHFYISTIIIIFIMNAFNAQYIQPGLCENQCHCPKGENVVHCDRQDHLYGVPTNIPNGITKLFIQQSDFPIPNSLNQANMTGLEKLEYLRIIYCNLQVIESRTFMKMTELKHLDLSHNSLIRIESYTFYGLQLNHLYLSEQHSLPDNGMLITEDSFHGLSANQINLRGNRIQSIHYEIFHKVPSLDRLILSDNLITTIDDGFEKYFNYPNKLLDLTGNPLECNCRLSWIVQRTIDWKDSLPGLNMTCIHFTKKQNSIQKIKNIYELVKLTPEQLCPTSRIQQIFINILDDTSRALISCTAVNVPKHSQHLLYNTNMIISNNKILSHTPPGVAWRYIESGQLREVRYLTTNNHLTNHNNEYLYQINSTMDNPSATVQLNITLDKKPRKYTCTTWDDKKETEEVIVTLKGPELINIPKINNTLSIDHELINTQTNTNINNRNYYIKQSDDLLRNEILYDQSYYLYQKQFTLLEMSIAVICTFLTTLIFLLISAKCLRLCKHYKLFQFTSSCSTIGINDTKSIYHPVKLINNDTNMIEQINDNNNNNNTPMKLNGIHSSNIINENGYNFIRTHTNPYSQMILSTLHGHNIITTTTTTNTTNTTITTTNNNGSNNNNDFSAQINQYPNLTNQYLTVTCNGNGLPPLPSPPSIPIHLASSSGSGTDDLQQSLAILTSTPLIQQHKLRNLLNNETNTVGLSPFLTNTQPHIRNWLIAPGSPYSITGSHVYDVPRTLEINQGTLPMSTGLVNRSSLLSESE